MGLLFLSPGCVQKRMFRLFRFSSHSCLHAYLLAHIILWAVLFILWLHSTLFAFMHLFGFTHSFLAPFCAFMLSIHFCFTPLPFLLMLDLYAVETCCAEPGISQIFLSARREVMLMFEVFLLLFLFLLRLDFAVKLLTINVY